MDEITVFAVVRPAAPGFDDADREAARRRLLAAATDERAAQHAAVRGDSHQRPLRRVRDGRAGKAIRHPGRRRVAIGAVAAGAAAAVGIAVVGVTGPTGHGGTSPARTSGPHSPSAAPSPGRAASAAELVVYATRAAAAEPPFDPKAHQWIYTETLTANSSSGGGGFLFGPPNERQTTNSWMRADRLQYAGIEHGKLVIQPVLGSDRPFTPAQLQQYQRQLELGGGLGGWPNASYPYLESLPTDPVKLKAIVAANVKADYNLTGYGDTGIFNAIQALIETVVLPPKLYAGLYGVLTSLHGVRFDAATDLAGRPGLGLYMVQEDYDKQEIVINPRTYAYMGYEDVATKAHTSVATDGTRYIRKGQVLGWQALIRSGIVDQPGQLP